MDPITVGAAGYVAGQIINKDLINKILGPSAELVGQNLKNYLAERGQKNVQNILDKTDSKLGKKANTKGSIPAKIVKDLIQNGAFCEDEIEAEYRAGVLASSRSEEGKDDSGNYFLNLINLISSKEVRLHYLFYHMIAQNLLKSDFGKKLNLDYAPDCERIIVYFKEQSLERHFSFSAATPLMQNCLILEKTGLIGRWMIGREEFLMQNFPVVGQIDSPGVVYVPTTAGFRLFLYAHGMGNLQTNTLQNPKNEFPSLIEGTQFDEATVSYRNS